MEDVEPETWTRPDMGNVEFSLKRISEFFRKDRREVRRGGGVGLWFSRLRIHG